MVDNCISWINLSHDAVSYDTYAKVRSSKREYYEAAMNAPELCVKAGLKVHIHFVRQKDNLHEVDSYIEKWTRGCAESFSIGSQIEYSKTGNSTAFDTEYFVKEGVQQKAVPWLCSSMLSFGTRMDGTVTGCCQMQTLVTDDNIYELPIPTMEDSVENIVKNMKKLIYMHKPFHKHCAVCGMYALRSIGETTHSSKWIINKSGRVISYTKSSLRKEMISILYSLNDLCPNIIRDALKKTFIFTLFKKLTKK